MHGADGLEEPPGPLPLPTYWWNKFSSSSAPGWGSASSSHLLPIGAVLPPAPGVTVALGWEGSILTPHLSGDAGSPHTSAQGGEETRGYSHLCSPRCPSPRPGCHGVI